MRDTQEVIHAGTLSQSSLNGHKQRKPLTGIELEMLRNACTSLKDKAIVEMFYSTGCRVTELERLDITDVDFQKKEVYLFGKGNKHRTSYLNAKAELAIRNYLASRNNNNPALFVSDREPHNRIKKAAIEKRVRKLGETSGIGRRVYPHLIRHTTATDWIEECRQRRYNRYLDMLILKQL